MSIIFSGLLETDTFSWLGLDAKAIASLTWSSPTEFFTNAVASTSDARRWVWLYRAPWTLLPETEQDDWQDLLHQWATHQRAVLKLRRELGSRLIMINVGQISPMLFCAELSLPQPKLWTCEASLLPTPAMASLFEQAAPHYWEVYETLESVAWLPVGGPQFRSNQPEFSEDSLFSLLGTLQRGLAWTDAQNTLLNNQIIIAELQRKLEESLRISDRENTQRQQLVEDNNDLLKHLDEMADQNQKAIQVYEEHQQALTKENELLLIHLSQVQEELESYYLANEELATAMDQSQQTMQRAFSVVTRLASHG